MLRLSVNSALCYVALLSSGVDTNGITIRFCHRFYYYYYYVVFAMIHSCGFARKTLSKTKRLIVEYLYLVVNET